MSKVSQSRSIEQIKKAFNIKDYNNIFDRYHRLIEAFNKVCYKLSHNYNDYNNTDEEMCKCISSYLDDLYNNIKSESKTSIIGMITLKSYIDCLSQDDGNKIKECLESIKENGFTIYEKPTYGNKKSEEYSVIDDIFLDLVINYKEIENTDNKLSYSNLYSKLTKYLNINTADMRLYDDSCCDKVTIELLYRICITTLCLLEYGVITEKY